MMNCLEQHQFHRAYKIAVRRWGQVELPLPEHSSHSLGALNEAVKSKALAERNAAKNLLDVHEQTCPVCSRATELVGVD
jgi:hypothetical protein